MSKNSKHIDLEMIESDESVTLSIGESVNTIPHPLYSSLFSPHENVSWLRALEKHNNSDSDDDSDGNSDEIQSMGSKNLAEENFLRSLVKRINRLKHLQIGLAYLRRTALVMRRQKV
ncbi:1177_t:CDS:2 [Funneliformis geosporum]|uniref:1177_t:CDS:1 n=1 Tax=Funneliformis geosporum TaxID=1117311 RepID=A0A9W4SKP5_9GLOM|nr:1177_t:CDS:2 [Funneliformis geosporum]